jgi:hypothetical protein
LTSSLQPFFPGQDYGSPFTAIVWVCVNPVERSFEACDLEASIQVYKGFKQAVMQRGLSREVLVAQSSCILGCSALGTTVLLGHRYRPIECYKGVSVSDIDTVLDRLLSGEIP